MGVPKARLSWSGASTAAPVQISAWQPRQSSAVGIPAAASRSTVAWQ